MNKYIGNKKQFSKAVIKRVLNCSMFCCYLFSLAFCIVSGRDFIVVIASLAYAVSFLILKLFFNILYKLNIFYLYLIMCFIPTMLFHVLLISLVKYWWLKIIYLIVSILLIIIYVKKRQKTLASPKNSNKKSAQPPPLAIFITSLLSYKISTSYSGFIVNTIIIIGLFLIYLSMFHFLFIIYDHEETKQSSICIE